MNALNIAELTLLHDFHSRKRSEVEFHKNTLTFNTQTQSIQAFIQCMHYEHTDPEGAVVYSALSKSLHDQTDKSESMTLKIASKGNPSCLL